MLREFNIDYRDVPVGVFAIPTGAFYFSEKTVRFGRLPGLSDRGQEIRPRKGEIDMRHKLKISVSKKPQMGGMVSCRNVTIREKLLSLLLGDKRRITVLIPGDNIGEIAICESEKGGDADGKSKVTA